MILQETARAIVTVVEYQGQQAVKKTFKKMELERFCEIMRIMFETPRSVRQLAIDIDERSYVMPFYPYTLVSYMEKKDGQADIRSLGRQLALCLFDLWINDYYHCDLHGDNIYVTENGQLFLGDWEHIIKREKGVPFWKSPDLIGGREVHAFWDKRGEVDINKILGVDSRFAVNIAREALRSSLNESGGAYHERVSKGQVYGSIRVPGFEQEGRRDPKARLDQFDVELHGKTILDLGCNAGAMSFEALNRGALYVIGIDLIAQRIQTAKEIASFAGLDDRAEFHKMDFDALFLDIDRADITFAFAIDHQTKDRGQLYDLLYRMTGELLLFESSLQKEYKNDIVFHLQQAGFKVVEYIGDSTESDRKKRCRMCFKAYKERN